MNEIIFKGYDVLTENKTYKSSIIFNVRDSQKVGTMFG